MIKGINRQIIEVTKTDNVYYERALLVVRPQFTGAERQILEREARKMLKEMNAPSILKSKKQLLRKVLSFLLPAIAGAVIAFCFSGLLISY